MTRDRRLPLEERPRPLSVGNIVTAAVIIYRSHLKAYAQLGLVGVLWSLVPVYGWAKANGIQAALSRLAFGELINQPETVQQARKATDPRMWHLFVVNLLVGLILGGLFIAWYMLFCVFAMVGAFAGATLGSVVGGITMLVAVLGSLVLLVVGITWFWSRLLLVELPIAVEESPDPSRAIQRSWNLAQGSIKRIQGVILIACFVGSIAWLPGQVVGSGLQLLIGMNNDSPSAAVLGFVVGTLFISLAGAVVMPFWQVLKAVMYFDLRIRREGFGLKLRGRPELL
jgi:hypothetical protein